MNELVNKFLHDCEKRKWANKVDFEDFHKACQDLVKVLCCDCCSE